MIRDGDLDDAFAIADLLVDDDHESVQRAVGGWIREAGRLDPACCSRSLTRAPRRCRAALRYAVESLDETARARYVWLARAAPES